MERAYTFDMSFKKILILCSFIIILLFSIFFIQRRNSSNSTSGHPTSTRIQNALKDPETAPLYNDLIPAETNTSKNPGYKEAPEFKIGQYTIKTSLPDVPHTLPVYVFKTLFSEEEVQILAKKLLGPRAQKDNSQQNEVIYTTDFGIFTFNTTLGTYRLQSLYLKLPQQIGNYDNLNEVKPVLTTYLKDSLGIIDDTVSLSALYKRKGEPSITYYEFHRTKDQVGLPIINPLGTVSFEEGKELEEAEIGVFDQKDASDDSIIHSTDSPGKTRQTDFNTMTVAVMDNGSIISIASNLRPLEEKRDFGENISIISPEQALQQAAQNGSYFNITAPAGEGYINLEKVYKDNKLTAKNAFVTDIALVYLEKPISVAQKYLQPMYVVRGNAETDTGVLVKFSQSIPALENSGLVEDQATISKSIHAFIRKIVPQVYAQEEQPEEITIPCEGGSTKKCRVIRVRKTPTATPNLPTITLYIPEPTVTPTLPQVCVLLNLNGSPIETGVPLFITGIGTVYYFPVNLRSGPFAMPDNTKTSLTNSQIYSAFYGAFTKHFLSIAAERILANPDLVYYIGSSSSVNVITNIKLNVIFPDVGLNLDLSRGLSYTGNYSDSTRYRVHAIKRALYETKVPGQNSLTLQQLAQLPRIDDLQRAGITLTQQWQLLDSIKLSYRAQAQSIDTLRLSEECDFLSTESPYIHFYTDEPRDILLNFQGNYLSYVDPIKADNLNFLVTKDGNIHFDTVSRKYLHYEYTDVTFQKPSHGWNMSAHDIQNFISQTLSKELGLNDKERNGLLKEVEGALIGKNLSDHVFVSLIPQSEIEQKLPYSMSPQPHNIFRIHLYIEFTESIALTFEPEISPIKRTDYYLVETGVYVK